MITNSEYIDGLFSFIQQSPSAFHAAAATGRHLEVHDFLPLSEHEKWTLEPGGKYYVTRNGAIVAFVLGSGSTLLDGFRIIGAHTDSPGLQLKPHTRNNSIGYSMFGVEKYGGALLNTWFDRELSLAGRISCVTADNSVIPLLIDFGVPLVYIPNIAIHLNREANNGQAINAQNDICPISGQTSEQFHESFTQRCLDQARKEYPDLQFDQVLGFDLFCYDTVPPSTFGLDNEFIAAPRLDNLASCHLGLETICQAGTSNNTMLIFTNHEEVGSNSASGALGNFAETVLTRILRDPEELAICQRNSFLLSIDNAHATHPNYIDKTDPDHEIVLNGGPVIKINANQRYTSSGQTASLFRFLATEAGVATQDFVMRSDMPCGSTIGPLTSSLLGVDAVDVGIPTWGMHSIREVTGINDPYLLYRTACQFFNRISLPVSGR